MGLVACEICLEPFLAGVWCLIGVLEGCSLDNCEVPSLPPSFKEKGCFLSLGCFLSFGAVCSVIWDLWGEKNNRVFRGFESDPCEVWSLVLFHVSL